MHEDSNGYGASLQKGLDAAAKQDLDQELERAEKFRKQLAQKLSFCNSVLDFPPEVARFLLKISPNEIFKLSQALRLIEDNKLEFSTEEVVELFDMARVERIMEEQAEREFSPGPTGPQGTQGAVGPTGANGPAGPKFGIPAKKPMSAEDKRRQALAMMRNSPRVVGLNTPRRR